MSPLDSLCSWVEYALPGLFHSTQASFCQLWREPLGRLPCVGWMWLDFVAVCIAKGEKHISHSFHFKFFSNLLSLNNRISPWKKIHWDSNPSNSRLGGEERSSFLNRSYHPITSPLPKNRVEGKQSKVYKSLSTQTAILYIYIFHKNDEISILAIQKKNMTRLVFIQQKVIENSKPGE